MTDVRSTPADLVTGLLGGTAERECERVVRLGPTDQQDVRAALAAVHHLDRALRLVAVIRGVADHDAADTGPGAGRRRHDQLVADDGGDDAGQAVDDRLRVGVEHGADGDEADVAAADRDRGGPVGGHADQLEAEVRIEP